MKNKKQNTMKLNSIKFALSAGIIVSSVVFISTLLATSGILPVASGVALIIFEIYGRIGYSVSFIGSILGAIFSFIDSFILAYIFAWIYNKLN